MAAVAHGPAARADRPGGAARHRAERARLPGHRPLRHGRPPARGRAQPRRPRGRGRRGARAGARGGRSASRAGWPASTWCPPSPRCAAAPTRSSSRCCEENEPRWESLSAADRERVEVMARAVVSRLLHEPTVRLKDARRTTTCTRCASCSGSQVRETPWRRSPEPAAADRLGTRGSALALAQARWVAERLPGEVELVDDHDARATVARPTTSRASSRRSRRRCWPARSTSPSTPPRTCRPSCPTDCRSWACRSAPIRSTRCAARRSLDELADGAVVGTASVRRRAQAARAAPRRRGARAARQRRHPAAAAGRGRLRRDRARARRAGAPRPRRRGRRRSPRSCPRRARAASRSRRAPTTTRHGGGRRGVDRPRPRSPP